MAMENEKNFQTAVLIKVAGNGERVRTMKA